MIFSLIVSLCISNAPIEPHTDMFFEEDTLKKAIVSDENWYESNHVDYATCNKFPWIGIANPPSDSTYLAKAQVGQPHGFPSIGVLPNASVIKSEPGVRFYKTSFILDSGATVTDCRLRIYVDDDIEIYINNQSVARENTGVPENRGGIPHDMIFFDFGTFVNPYNGGDPFDLVTFDPIANYFLDGTNEVTVAVRNKTGDRGGFSFRMDLNYVLNPDWVSLNQYDTKNTPFTLYPNPARDILEISNNNLEVNKVIELSVVNSNGAILLKHDLSKLETQSIDISGLAPGVYSVLLNDGSTIFRHKLVKL